MCGQIATCGQIAEMTKDPRMAWVLIQEAALRERSDELAEIAVNLFGQLGEARAEISRLRVARHLGQPASVVGALDGVNPVARAELGDDRREVVAYGPDRQMHSLGDLGGV